MKKGRYPVIRQTTDQTNKILSEPKIKGRYDEFSKLHHFTVVKFILNTYQSTVLCFRLKDTVRRRDY